MKHNVFKRLKDFQIGEPIWQPVIFAVLIILISVTLYFIQQMWAPSPCRLCLM